MDFAQPLAFLLLLLLPAFYGISRSGRRRRDRLVRAWGDITLLQASVPRFPRLRHDGWRLAFLFATVVSIVFALSDPRLPAGTLRLREGTLDVVFLMDVSKSMAAEDYGRRSRLEKAKEIARALLADLRGNRVGLVTFAGTSFRQAELTEDLSALDFILRHWVQVDAVGLGGSDIAQAIETGIALCTKDPTRQKLLLLFSDGGDKQQGLEPVLAKAVRRGIKVVTFGLGTASPSPIPLYDGQGRFTGYLKIDDQVVTTRLNEERLRHIAQVTGGTYQRVTLGPRWQNVFTRREVVGDILEQENRKLFQFFLGLGLLSFTGYTLTTRL
ncbi:MAG: VWA domain-containing protein [Nitrospinota bacterium]|nr:MAG: VWA domain-containing protein [Nitrospinota bacterium]